ncbi:MAG: hypothetical protein J6O41_06770 [Clostridia bacterium]|nr:hypothetical protein [Clostridia bacterium]
MGLKVNFVLFRAKALLLLLVLFSSDFALENLKDSKDFEQFQKFMIKYNKNYESEEELEKRFGYFKESLKFIEENKDKVSHKIGINKYSDISEEEWHRMFPPFDLSGLESLTEKGRLFMSKIEQKEEQYPETLDFRTQDKVTHVKNQNPCNTCPIFATIATIEAQYKNKVGVLESFSEQQLFDCLDYHIKCENLIVLTRIQQYYGNLKYLYKEEFYKYKFKDNKKKCKSFEQAKNSGKNEAIRLNSVEFITGTSSSGSLSIDQIKGLLNEIQGPIAVIFDSALIRGYVGGIIKTNPEKCSSAGQQDHAVVIVGYGVDKDGSIYWIVKNSYGEDWGESGYFRVLAGENLCLIENLAIFPDIDSLDFYDWCSMEGCIKCSNSDSCSKCGMGYYLEGNTCKKCMDNCMECTNNEDCKQCDKWGGYFPGSNICYKCPEEYELCEGTLEFCKDNYYHDPNSDPSCVRSKYNNCQFSIKTDSGEICQMCDDGYGLFFNNGNNECKKCMISNCRTCTFDEDGVEECQKCIDGYSEPSFADPPYSSCSKCKDGCNYCLKKESSYQDEDGICFDCPEGCKKCELIFKDTFESICTESDTTDKVKPTDGTNKINNTSLVFILLMLLL